MLYILVEIRVLNFTLYNYSNSAKEEPTEKLLNNTSANVTTTSASLLINKPPAVTSPATSPQPSGQPVRLR